MTTTNKPSSEFSTNFVKQGTTKGDFAAGERTMPGTTKAGDFATGEHTLPTSTSEGDFATGEHELPAADKVGDFATGEHTLPPAPENPRLTGMTQPLPVSVPVENKK